MIEEKEKTSKKIETKQNKYMYIVNNRIFS